MFRNYFIIAIRNFWKNKIFSLINISGLAIGISAALVIYLLVYYEFSFDKFHKDGDRIFRVVSNLNFPGQLITNGGVSAPLPEAFKREVTGIETASAFHTYNAKVTLPTTLSDKPVIFKNQQDIIFADNDYFRLIPYTWLAGSPQTSLTEPFKVVLTESRAKTYFPGTGFADIPGRTVTYNDSIHVSVSGIVKDLDEATDFIFKEFISLSTVPNSGLKNNMSWNQWGSVNSASQFLVKLNKGVTPKQVEQQLVFLRNKYHKDDFMKTENLLQPLGELHFTGDYDMFSKRQAHKPALYGLLAVAAFLLMLGCINFINLTTAQAALRAKEIGVRKTMGSSKRHLVLQFLGETFLFTALATMFSILLAPLILKIFSDFMPPELKFSIVQQPHIIIFIILLIPAVSLLSGIYPALVLAGFKPVLVLKNQAYGGSAKTRKAWLRKSLTVSQFVIAQFFIIATLLVSKQIHYSINKSMGFRKDAVVFVQAPWNDRNPGNRFVLLNKLRSVPEFEMVSLAGSPPATTGYSTTSMKFNDGKKEIESMVEIKSADSVYFKLYNLKLAAGRLPQENDSLVKGYLINETYAKFLGYQNAADIVGKQINRGDKKGIPISGVLKDFHFKSTHNAIKPLAYTSVTGNYFSYHILLKPNNAGGAMWKNGIAGLEKAWKEVYPDFDFEYKFMDESIAGFYKAEQNISRLLKWAAGLCIFISCLGLLGLVIYTTNLRTKEIGVRKVLGASVMQIVSLLSKDFLALVLVAFAIAAPLAWWAMNKWLQDFAYRTAMSWWVFAGCGLGMIIIALLTLSLRTIKAAGNNPVGALRSE